MVECPGRMSGSRRLRGDLARKVEKQVATAVELLHSAGVMHAGWILTLSRSLLKSQVSHHQSFRALTLLLAILALTYIIQSFFFQIAEMVNKSVDDIYHNLGRLEVEKVVTRDRSPPLVSSSSSYTLEGCRRYRHLVFPLLHSSKRTSASSMSASLSSLIVHRVPATPPHYLSPDAFLT